jgi:predicted phage tail protein
MIRHVYFYGALAKKYGQGPHVFDVDTMAMLFSGFSSRFDGFKQEFIKDDWAILRGDPEKKAAEQIHTDEFGMTLGKMPELHFIPKTEGSYEEAIAYIAEYLAAYFAEGALSYTLIYYGAIVVLNLALAYAVSALSAALSPSPKTGNDGTGTKADHQSFLFSGPQNVVEQGGPVPLVYGEFRTGSTIVSIGIAPEEIPVT